MEWIVPERFNDAELYRIVTFFVFHCPCKNVSAMGKSLAEYGWNAPWKKPFHLNKQLKQASTSQKSLFSISDYKKTEEALEECGMKDDFPKNIDSEKVFFYDSEKNQFMSVFRHIRNSFSHGRLNMIDFDGDCIFIFEDVTSKQNKAGVKLSARMILRKSTLLKWIEIIEGGEKEYIVGSTD